MVECCLNVGNYFNITKLHFTNIKRAKLHILTTPNCNNGDHSLLLAINTF